MPAPSQTPTEHPDGSLQPAEVEHLSAGFARRLREERHAAGYTQQQVADAAGLNVRSVERFEAGQLRPTDPAILAMSLAIRRPHRVKARRYVKPDCTEAFALHRELSNLAGESLRPGGDRHLRRQAAHHLTLHGITEAERVAEINAATDKLMERAGRQIAAHRARQAQ